VACIRISDMGFSYDNRLFTLKDIDLNLCEAEVTTVLGPNGAGKTTLLKCLARILKPQKGTIYIDGRDLWKMSLYEAAKIIGYSEVEIPRGFNVKVLDFLSTSRYPHMATFFESSEDIKAVKESLKEVDAEKFSLRKIEQLSSGELQRIVIAKILAKKPKILLLDEPTLHLDIKYQIDILKKIREITKKHKLITIMTIHDLRLASMFSDKIILLKNGKIVSIGSPSEVLTPKNIEETYGIRVKVIKDTEVGVIVVPLP